MGGVFGYLRDAHTVAKNSVIGEKETVLFAIIKGNKIDYMLIINKSIFLISYDHCIS